LSPEHPRPLGEFRRILPRRESIAQVIQVRKPPVSAVRRGPICNAKDPLEVPPGFTDGGGLALNTWFQA